MAMTIYLGKLFIETAVVGIICVIFLALFIVAGIKQAFEDKE